MHENSLGKLTTSLNEKASDALDMPLPVCASGPRHMWFLTA